MFFQYASLVMMAVALIVNIVRWENAFAKEK